MKWKKIIKYDEERHDALGGLTFREYLDKLNAEEKERENTMTRLEKLYRSIQNYTDATIADEMSRLLYDYEDIDRNAFSDISRAISEVEEAIYNVGYTIEDWIEREKERLKEEEKNQLNQEDKK